MTVDNLLKLRQARQNAADTLKAKYSFEAKIAYDNAARAFEYALNVAAEDLLKMVEPNHEQFQRIAAPALLRVGGLRVHPRGRRRV